jgi:Flp pilus assembly secretin CpaC
MHKGRGPKNYQRSDERIKEDINDRLSDDWFIDASEIDVTVSSGEVTLTGTVDDRSDKRRAEDIAESVSGVKQVENRLRIGSYQNTGSGSYTTTPGATSIGTGSGSVGTSQSKAKSSYAETK